MALKFDKIGYWSEVKLEIVRKYAAAYSQILSSQESPRLHHVYIDGFSGPGVHVSKATGEFIQGSPLNALNVHPPFRHYYLIDLDGDKIEHLRSLVGARTDVSLLNGDGNNILTQIVFPQVRFEDYCRGLCLLDPYGLHLDWTVIETAGKMRSLDLFLNFPTLDMNRNALWRDPSRVAPEEAARMAAFWGDDSWRTKAYKPSPQMSFLGDEQEKASNEEVARAFRERLVDGAGFKHVPEPMPMRNSKGAVVYYLFFASQKPVAGKIVTDIFRQYAERRS